MVKICNNNPSIHATTISFTSNLQLYELLFSAHYTESVYNMLVYTGTCALHRTKNTCTLTVSLRLSPHSCMRYMNEGSSAITVMTSFSIVGGASLV